MTNQPIKCSDLIYEILTGINKILHDQDTGYIVHANENKLGFFKSFIPLTNNFDKNSIILACNLTLALLVPYLIPNNLEIEVTRSDTLGEELLEIYREESEKPNKTIKRNTCRNKIKVPIKKGDSNKLVIKSRYNDDKVSRIITYE
jgi:hypothetical protein